MKRFSLFGAAALLILLAVPGLAQSPSESPPAASGQYCITVAGEPPAGGWDAVSLAQAVTDQTAYLTYVEDAEACASAATPETTAAPVVTPKPTPVPGATYDAYVVAVTPSLLGLVTWTEAIGSDATNGNLHALKIDFTHLRALSQKALRWMNSHDPQPCYETLYNDEKQVFTLILNSATHGLRGLARYSVSEINRSGNLIDQATQVIIQINDNDEINTASSACTYDPGIAG